MSDNNQNGQSYATRAKTALDNVKLKLSTKCPTDESRFSTMHLSIYENNAQFVIYTNDPKDKENRERNNGKIDARMSLVDLQTFFYLFEQTINGSPGEKHIIQTHRNEKNQDNKSVVVPASRLVFGKNKNGEVFITIDQEGLSKIVFIYGYNRYTKFLDSQGNPLPKDVLSVLTAKAWLETLKSLTMSIAANNFTDHTERRRTQGGGGYQKNGGGNGGYRGNGGYQKGNNNYRSYGNSNSGSGSGGGNTGYAQAGQDNSVEEMVDLDY